MNAQSDFVGPLLTGSHMSFTWFADPEETQRISSQSLQVSAPSATIYLLTHLTTTPSVGFDLPAEGASTALRVTLNDPSGNRLDTGVALAPFSGTVGVGAQAAIQHQVGTQGGLTDEQSLQLSETHAASFTDQLIDNVTLTNLTPVPSAGPVNANLLDTTFGVIVRLTTIPPELVPVTPDESYWVKTLCVVRIFRGTDLWKRYPIHTESRLISFLDESVVASVSALTATQWLLNMTMQVTFLPGVTGQVFLMRFP